MTALRGFSTQPLRSFPYTQSIYIPKSIIKSTCGSRTQRIRVGLNTIYICYARGAASETTCAEMLTINTSFLQIVLIDLDEYVCYVKTHYKNAFECIEFNVTSLFIGEDRAGGGCDLSILRCGEYKYFWVALRRDSGVFGYRMMMGEVYTGGEIQCTPFPHPNYIYILITPSHPAATLRSSHLLTPSAASAHQRRRTPVLGFI